MLVLAISLVGCRLLFLHTLLTYVIMQCHPGKMLDVCVTRIVVYDSELWND